jgi:hypothetical protein
MVAMTQIAVPFADDNLIVGDVVGAAPRADPGVRALGPGPLEPPVAAPRRTVPHQRVLHPERPRGLALSGGAA